MLVAGEFLVAALSLQLIGSSIKRLQTAKLNFFHGEPGEGRLTFKASSSPRQRKRQQKGKQLQRVVDFRRTSVIFFFNTGCTKTVCKACCKSSKLTPH
jgi:hypothetical protein